ncbi:hydroxyacid dehydrogenase [Oceanobacillus arenosus]|uniref:Hydroxyacid dehydrogenase n=1 Tax=Oceanobacillus arenosus TaxID=1229153 RepID=A0A3D8Q454_9BACI|nr:C-terminal binding protein [Oceanobacillus arenosus]RDW22165.1 hydroxyacid dehydrogenase [Oceanobacillus arenosus]
MKVVITDHEYPNLKYEKKVLAHDGIELEIHQCKTEDEVIEVCREADGIINLYAPISRRVIESLEKCKIITRYGVGVDTIDLDAATEKEICIGNVPDYGINEVSDHALALIMSLLRKIPFANQTVKNDVWDVNTTKSIRRLSKLTIGLVGFGNIPRRLSEKVKVLGLKIVVSDPFLPEEVAKDHDVELVSLEELCERADVISVHAPLTDSTKGMIGKEQFNLMKKGVYLVNTARGPVVDEEALLEALHNGTVAAVGLDVVENEPIDRNHPFLSMDNVILTPHMAGYSEESAEEMRSKTALGIIDVLVYGQYPKYLVNKGLQEKLDLKAFEMREEYKF